MDVAASEFYKDNLYDLDFKNPKSNKKNWINSEKLTAMYNDFIKSFPIVSIEDPFEQDHWDAFAKFTETTNIQIVGDDLTVTNPERIQKAIDNKACNCLLLKVNQIGESFPFGISTIIILGGLKSFVVLMFCVLVARYVNKYLIYWIFVQLV